MMMRAKAQAFPTRACFPGFYIVSSFHSKKLARTALSSEAVVRAAAASDKY
jgi:hypothetical protein